MMAVDQIRKDLALHDAGYAWGTKHENVATLLAERDRLHAALRKIADDGRNCMDHCRRQARRALGEE
jgi:hypothetical protein